MKSIIEHPENQHKPVKIWSELGQVESTAIQQLKNMASLPFVFKHVAAMPDVHLGIGATVGSVVATKGAVIPAAVGVDIGCGMMALRLNVNPEVILESTNQIRIAIESVVPVGRDKNKKVSKTASQWQGWARWKTLHATQGHRRGESDLKSTAMAQLGSLGGGNHFIELCQDTQKNIWIVLHSGSRNIGKSLAESHIAQAKYEMKMLSVNLPDPDLAYYVESSEGYQRYMRDLIWAQDYAAQNRVEMMARIFKVVNEIVEKKTGQNVTTTLEVNCHHNYASLENHYGENVLITRKGAVRAHKGDYGIIPGSMGTRSYIVEGLGNPESFMSCSHGAGRRMSRTEAKKRFTLKDLADQTAGVNCRKDAGVLDEIPGAYKDIDEVMENQKDLVRVVAQLKQFMCIKG
ncbi:MAG: RtcB family protein [Bdellovibrionota bacterium]